MDQQTNKLKADLLAGEIMQLAHATLLVHLRFMENALCRLRFEPMHKGTVWTDGQRYSYAPRHVLGRYREEREAPARDYLHCVLRRWLNTPGFDNSFAATVSPDSAVVPIGSFVDADDYAVRPALWLRTDA